MITFFGEKRGRYNLFENTVSTYILFVLVKGDPII